MRIGTVVVLVAALSVSLHTQFSVPPRVLSPHLQAQSDVSKLKQGDRGRRKAAIFSLHANGKEAIPVLIESLDDTAPFEQIELLDPISSFIPPESRKPTYMGVLYAYAIELILGKKTLRGNQRDSGFLIDNGDCVYKLGLLKREGESLTPKDLSILKEIYRQWWEAHKQLSLDELRQQWIENKRPLTGSRYKWS